MSQNVADLRLDYRKAALSEQDADPDPIRQFGKWFQEALNSDLVEPNAMTLATVAPGGQPSARIVLLKGFDGRGFTFFTNYTSPKGKDLARNPKVALVFYWAELERQVRITGVAGKIPMEESREYFESRPRGSQIGAHASRQSAVLGSREELESEVERLEAHYSEGPIPLPSHWGGFRVRPATIEFWQGRSNRLHDRILYRRSEEGWLRERLSP